jgi:GTP cyclohydrolase I
MEALVRAIIAALGEDPDRAGLRRTPARFVRALQDLTRGDRQGVDIVRPGHVTVRHDEIVLVRDIPIASLCEHHLLPFFGRCHVAYISHRKVLRPSKLVRLIGGFCRQLQVQERLTKQIASTLWEIARPRAVSVVIEASHLCMMMRGVEKPNAQAVTSIMLGLFRTNPKTRAKLMQLIGRQP